ncbi:MAG: imidazolonepropionase-like amidohydrolase [Halioglobus sp.]|jgi:imidazolonepropionase-like amidohydrolase
MHLRNILAYLFTGMTLALHGASICAENIVITNARLIDGTGTAPVIGANIVIKGEHIVSVGNTLNETGVFTVIDASGLTVMPGLIDMQRI